MQHLKHSFALRTLELIRVVFQLFKLSYRVFVSSSRNSFLAFYILSFVNKSRVLLIYKGLWLVIARACFSILEKGKEIPMLIVHRLILKFVVDYLENL